MEKSGEETWNGKFDSYLDKFHNYAPLVLRIGMGLIFLWFGFTQLKNPSAWVSYIPEWLGFLPISFNTFVILNGVVEIILAVFLIVGFFTRISALILGVHLLGITFSIGLNPTGIRDFGLAIATLFIFLYGPDKFSVDYKFRNSSGFERVNKVSGKILSKDHKNYLKYIIPLIILILIMNIGFFMYQQSKLNNLLDELNRDSVANNENIEDMVLTVDEISKHNTENDCWLLIDNKVYDVTSYIPFHPGGKNEIIIYCGTESSQAFSTKGGKGKEHSTNAHNLLNAYYIGDLGGSSSGGSGGGTGDPNKVSYCEIQDIMLDLYPAGQVKHVKDKLIEFEVKVISEGQRYKLKLDPTGIVTKVEDEDPEGPIASGADVCFIEEDIIDRYPNSEITEIRWKPEKSEWESKYVDEGILWQITHDSDGNFAGVKVV